MRSIACLYALTATAVRCLVEKENSEGACQKEYAESYGVEVEAATKQLIE